MLLLILVSFLPASGNDCKWMYNKVQGCYDHTFTITVTLVPEEKPVHVGGVAVFSSVLGPPLGANRQWIITGTQFDRLILTGVAILFVNLQFTNTPLRYNCTTVQCTLTTRTGVQQSSILGALGNCSQLHSMYLSYSHYRVVGCCF